MDRQTEMHTDTQKDTQIRYRDKLTDIHAYRLINRHICTVAHRQTHTDRHANRHTDRQRCTQTGKHKDRHSYRHTDIQRSTKTGKQTDTHIDIRTERDAHRQTRIIRTDQFAHRHSNRYTEKMQTNTGGQTYWTYKQT